MLLFLRFILMELVFFTLQGFGWAWCVSYYWVNNKLRDFSFHEGENPWRPDILYTNIRSEQAQIHRVRSTRASSGNDCSGPSVSGAVSPARGRERQDTCQSLQPQRGRGIHPLRSSCARVGSPWIKRRSVTPNRVNKWQMLWILLSSVTTEGLKGPRDCFHMKVAFQQNHRKPLPHSADWMELGCLVSAHKKNTNRHAKAEFEQFICLAHGLGLGFFQGAGTKLL